MNANSPLLTPAFTETEARNRATFLALMWAFSYPGRPQQLPGAMDSSAAAFESIGDTLLDLEVSYFTDDVALDHYLQRTTSHLVAVSTADYLFFPAVTDVIVALIDQAKTGDMLYPDQAATLVLGCTFEGDNNNLRLSGPGIVGTTEVAVGQILRSFWALRERIVRFPLGWDVLLVSGDQVIGIPRSVNVEWMGE